jgi:tetratricopeptide (TPR) repeat protein
MAALQIISFALINSIFAYVVLGVAALFILLFLPRLIFSQEEKISLGILVVLLILVSVLVNVKGVGNSVLKPLISGNDKSISINKPLRLPLSAAWQTSARAVADRPIRGSGPSTFGMIFPSFKPISLNRINENNVWNVRFDESGSGVLNLLATTGVIGFLIFLVIIGVLVRNIAATSLGNRTNGRLSSFIFLQAAVVAGLASWFLFDISALTGLALLLLIAAFYTTLRDFGSSIAGDVNLQLVALRSGAIRAVEAGTRVRHQDALSWVFFIPAVFLLGAVLFMTWGTYKAEFFYQRAIVASTKNQGKDTRDNLVEAIRANPYRDTYHRALLVTDLALARSLSQQGNLSDEQRTTLEALVREAIERGKIITGYEAIGLGNIKIERESGTSFLNVANWESLATVYANIGGQLKQDASVHAINTYSQAINLDPTNPRLYEALGNVYRNLGDLDNAIENYEEAVRRKLDFASGHYSLAQALRQKGDNPAAVVNELQATLQLLKDDERSNKKDIERIEKEFEEAKKVLKKAQPQGQQTQPLQQAQPSTGSALPGQ